MQTRHRVPTVFTLYMVDVFCCALGCIILLWLVNAREARRRGAAYGETAKQLADVRVRLASADGELTALRAGRLLVELDRDRVEQQLKAMGQERDRLAQTAS